MGYWVYQIWVVYFSRYFDFCVFMNIQILSLVMVYFDFG